MRVGSGSFTRIAYFKFAVAGLTGSVTQATLKVYNVTGGTGFSVRDVPSDTWSETTLNWNNKPGTFTQEDSASYYGGDNGVNGGAACPTGPSGQAGGQQAGCVTNRSRPAASRSASALSTRSQVKSWSSRPKWPYAAVFA